jgi:hypothetical protein
MFFMIIRFSFLFGLFLPAAILGVSYGWSADKSVPSIPGASGNVMDRVSAKVHALKSGGKEKSSW